MWHADTSYHAGVNRRYLPEKNDIMIQISREFVSEKHITNLLHTHYVKQNRFPNIYYSQLYSIFDGVQISVVTCFCWVTNPMS